MELKKRLVGLRRGRGLTQDELAREVGVTRQAVSKWERGIIAPSTLNLIALGQLYGIPLDELVNGESPPREEPAAVAVAAAEKPEADEPRGIPGPLKIAAAAVLAVCVLLTTAAAIITIWSAVFKEPEKPKDNVIWMDDLKGEEIDLTELVPFYNDEWNFVEE